MNGKILILSLLLLLVFISACGKKEQQKTATTTTLQQETPLQNDVDDLDDTITGLDDSSLDNYCF